MGCGTLSGDDRCCDGPRVWERKCDKSAMQIRNSECLLLPKDLLMLVRLLSRSALGGLYSRGTSS